MKFEKLSLANFQSYNKLDIEFDDGLTMIYGPNGAGKSTITRALYTTFYPRYGRNHIGAHGLSDLIQDGKESATSELIFSVGDERYKIRVEISRRSDGGATSDPEMIVLPTGKTYSTKSGEIEEKVTQLLGMDSKAFANSTYAQQTELNRLIEATPSEREEILDNLLGLTAPDEYEEDVDKVTDPIDEWLEDKRSKLQNVRSDIAGLEADNPKDTLQSKTEEVEQLEDEIGRFSEGLEDARERLREIEIDIEDHRERKSDVEDLKRDRNEVKSTIDGLQSDIDDLQEQINQCSSDIEDHRERIAELDDGVDDFELTNRNEADDAVDHYEDEYDNANTATEQRRSAVESAKRTVNRLESELGELKDELADAESHRDHRKDEVIDAENELNDAGRALEKCRDERDEVLGEYLETPLEEVDGHESAVRGRMDDLRTEKSELKTKRKTKRDRRSRLADEINTFEDELAEARERREDIRQSLNADVEDPETAFEAAVDRADEKASSLGFSVTTEDIDTVFTGSLPEELEVALDDHRGAAEGLADARETVGNTAARIEDLQSLADGEWPLDGDSIGTTHDYSDHIGRLEEERRDAQSTVSAVRKDLNTAETRLERVQDVAEALFEAASFRALADVASEISELESEIDTAQDNRTELQEDIESLNARIDRLEAALDQGQTALGSIKNVEEAATAVEEAERELGDARDDLAVVEREIEELETDIDNKQTELDEAREDVETAENKLTKAEDELAEIKAARDAAREARDAYANIDTLESDREGYQSQRADKKEQLESKREELQQIEEDIEDLQAELDDTTLEELKDREQEIKEIIDDVEEQLETAREKRDDAVEVKSKAEDRLDRLREKRNRKAELQEKMDWAQNLLNDFGTITNTYSQVQTRMREKVLDRLKLHTNKIFRDLYQNSTYEAVDIDENYELRLISGSETSRDPHKASGGEGVLVTIALRAGVYRVLADQAEGRDERLPPFILDEPTNHLDDSHIEQLEEAVESIRDWNVPQVFVVDRYEGLVEDADNRIHVEMNDGDGGSTVEVDPTITGGGKNAEAGGD